MASPPADQTAPLRDAIRAAYVDRQLLARRALLATRELWAQIDPAAIRASYFAGIDQRLQAIVTGAQLATANNAANAVTALLEVQGIDPAERAVVDPAAFAGIASDGRELASLLELGSQLALRQIGAGQSADAALAISGRWLEMVVGTQVVDAARMATSVSTTARSHVSGWYRLLNPPSCSRCAVLAGRWYRWDAGFLRHPRCDCWELPAGEGSLDDFPELWTPQSYFDSLTAAEQDARFTTAGAQAIREGSDIARVVNARRGMDTASIGGRQVLVTHEATSAGVHGVRLMPEQIYRIARGDRDEALRLLESHGYLHVARPRHHGAGGGGGNVPPADGGTGDGGPLLGDLIPHRDDIGRTDWLAIRDALASVIEGQYGGLSVGHVEVTGAGKDRLSWNADILDDQGGYAGPIMRQAERRPDGTLSVYHQFLEIEDPDLRGLGFGSAFSASMEDWYRRSGVAQIKLHAGLDDGGFVWAMAGYQWADPSAPDEVVSRLGYILDRRDGTPAELAEVARMLQRLQDGQFGTISYPKPYDVAIMGRTPGAGDWIGRHVMRGSNWKGVKRLNDDSAR